MGSNGKDKQKLLLFLQVQLSERSAEAETALQRLTELSAKVEEQRDLIVRLEEDIQKVGARCIFLYGLVLCF